MLNYIFALLLTAVALSAIVLKKTYAFLPAKELKRRAEHGDELARPLWNAVAYGRSLYVLLWLIIGFSVAGAIVLFARIAPPLFGVLGVALIVAVGFAWLPNSRLTSSGARFAAMVTPLVVKVVSFLQPVLERVAGLVGKRLPYPQHTRLFEKDDLIALIERQRHQPDSRFTEEELNIASAALMFGSRTVDEITTPRSEVIAVTADDDVSPVLLDELHKTGHSRFPVTAKDSAHVVGTLHLRELTDVSEGKGAKGRVQDYADKHVYYVHENDSIASALHAFYQTKHQLFVVINNFEEYVGIITIEDILRALIGDRVESEFDLPESRVAVAAKHKHSERPVDDVLEESEEGEIKPAEEPVVHRSEAPTKPAGPKPETAYDDLEIIEEDDQK